MTFLKKKKNFKSFKLIPFIQPIYSLEKIFGYEILLRKIENNKIYLPNVYFFERQRFDSKHKTYIKKEFDFYKKVLKKTENKKYFYFINLDINFLKKSCHFYNFLFTHLRKRKNNNLIFEILEDNLLDSFMISFAKDIIKTYNCQIAIDDITYTKQDLEKIFFLLENINFLKIDGNLIKNCEKESNHFFLKEIIKISTIYNKKIVFEHIENEDIFKYIKSLLPNERKDLFFFQGYYFGKPILF